MWQAESVRPISLWCRRTDTAGYTTFRVDEGPQQLWQEAQYLEKNLPVNAVGPLSSTCKQWWKQRQDSCALHISNCIFGIIYPHQNLFLLLVYWWACCSFNPDFPLFLCDLIWFFSQLAVSSTRKCTPVRDVLMKPNTQSNSDETNSNQQEWRSCLHYSTLCLPASGFVWQSDKKIHRCILFLYICNCDSANWRGMCGKSPVMQLYNNSSGF